MKKSTMFVMAAILAVTVGSFGFAETAKPAAASAKAAAVKAPAKAAANTPAKPAPAPKTVLIVKGVQIEHCGRAIKDNGFVTILGMDEVKIQVKNGKFDLVLPTAPVLTELISMQRSDNDEASFGDAKVYYIHLDFSNSNQSEGVANGRAMLSFKLIYAETSVKGTINGKPVLLKKGWNVVGNKSKPTAGCICAG